MVTMFKGSGLYELNIVGESFHQNELNHLAGPKTTYGCEVSCIAALLLEDSNPHDQNAVKVLIVELDANRTLAVGHLSRGNAKKFRKALEASTADTREHNFCRAMIVGGWDSRIPDPDLACFGRDEWDFEERSVGHYGVKLDIIFPLEVDPLWEQTEANRQSSSPTTTPSA